MNTSRKLLTVMAVAAFIVIVVFALPNNMQIQWGRGRVSA
jgi:hypothetical protein